LLLPLLLPLHLPLLLPLHLPFSNPLPGKNRHFDRSCSQPHSEQRSGEIHFSTPTQPNRVNPRRPRRQVYPTGQTKNILKNLVHFRGPFYVVFSPRFHHKFVHIYHAKHHVLHTQFLKNPLKNKESPRRKKSAPQ
jgi:hypothetical protein